MSSSSSRRARSATTRWSSFFIINGLLLLVGTILEPLPTMVIFLPALLPVAETLNIDPIHFGALVVVNLMIGLLTPPVGLLLFVVSSISNVPVTHIVREVWPHLLWSIIVLALLILFPPLSTWLPSQIRGSSRARRDP